MYIGYSDIDKGEEATQRSASVIRSYAQQKGLRVEKVVQSTNLRTIFEPTEKKTNVQGIIIESIQSLGKDLESIKEQLKLCQEHQLGIISIKEGYNLSASSINEGLIKGLELAIRIKKDLHSQQTQTGLRQAKASGKTLGRKRGQTIKKRLSGKEEEIKELLRAHTTRSAIAAKLDVTRMTLYNFMKHMKPVQRRKTPSSNNSITL